jgi:cytochrome c
MRRRLPTILVLAAAALAAASGALALEDDEGGELGPEDRKAAKAAEDAALRLGQKTFADPSLGTNGKSCSVCHDNPRRPDLSLKGVAAKFPKWDRTAGKVLTLQQKFAQMQQRSLKAGKPLPLGDDRWNGLELYLRGLK